MFAVLRALSLLAFFVISSLASAQDDVAQGEKLFEVQCKTCHTVKPGVNGFGPSLAGVVGHGRAAAGVPGVHAQPGAVAVLQSGQSGRRLLVTGWRPAR